MRLRKVESRGMNGYYISTSGQSIHDSEKFSWGSYETVGLVSRFKAVQKRGEGLAERALEDLEKEVKDRFGEGDYIYALPKPRNAQRIVLMRLLEKKIE